MSFGDLIRFRRRSWMAMICLRSSFRVCTLPHPHPSPSYVLTAALIIAIEMYSKRIERLDMKHLKACAGKYEIAETLDAHGLSVFHSTYRSLNTLLRRFRRSKTTTTTTTGGTTTTTTNPLSFKTPPQQQTVPETPSHTGG